MRLGDFSRTEVQTLLGEHSAETGQAFTPQASLPQISPTWLNPDGSLNPDQLLNAFLAFWRRHGEPLLGSAPYHEIAPHLVLMAFLQRVVNGEGSLEREYAIGRGRMDLLPALSGSDAWPGAEGLARRRTGPAAGRARAARRLPSRLGPGQRLASDLRSARWSTATRRATLRQRADEPRRAADSVAAALSTCSIQSFASNGCSR